MLYACEFVVALFVILNFKQINTVSIQLKLKNYEQYINTSLQIEQQDKSNIDTWSEEFQVQLVNVTTKYRLQMTRHQQYNFKKKTKNEKWQTCLRMYQSSTTKLEQAYYIQENECLRNASSADDAERETVIQVGREIRKWRRTYRYLNNRCAKDNPDDKGKAGICLVKYMERDNYAYTFQRLFNLRLQAVEDLHQKLVHSVATLEECLQMTLSRYLEFVRATMDVLSGCYDITNYQHPKDPS